MRDWRGCLKIGAYTAELGRCHDRPGLEEVCFRLHILVEESHDDVQRHMVGLFKELANRGGCVVHGGLRIEYCAAHPLSCRPVRSCVSWHSSPLRSLCGLDPGVEAIPIFHAQVGARRYTSAARWHS